MEIKINTKKYIEYIEMAAKKIEASKDYVTELDSITGDGDHWVNMNMGFEKLVETKEELATMDLGPLFQKIGMLLMSTVGGSSGVLYGSAYIKAAKTIGDQKEMDINLLCDVLEAKVNAIMERGNAKPGCKTMIDTLYPAVTALKEALEKGLNDYDALQALKQAAIDGMNSTKDMEALKGRACYQSNKGAGHIDPGAVTMCYQIEVLVECLCKE
ncbi:dihydroxyacetone kinase subunit DhaL [Natronincola ferrireducens]|uniref:phosphoenolpyruvate--glycerone phosphotransferase n=1 Tax=Natronincola ferrireducens TaxID=393762 RepID=A0A1G8XB39_9FIRM|nr:dihydroxyacetone kinase subunit DhaL [Natronincola ferrireducens]SDJ87858.1 dihydroxyacetone kinase DhaL subunit [Natronincola ferrireducens]